MHGSQNTIASFSSANEMLAAPNTGNRVDKRIHRAAHRHTYIMLSIYQTNNKYLFAWTRIYVFRELAG